MDKKMMTNKDKKKGVKLPLIWIWS